MAPPPSDTVLLRRVPLWTCACVGALALGVFGAVAGVLLALTLPVVTSFWSDFAEVEAGAMVASLVFVPLASAAAGFAGGLVFAGAFNAVARWTGGVRVTVARHPAPPKREAAADAPGVAARPGVSRP